jgi:glutamate dehydrogenase (NADP+)
MKLVSIALVFLLSGYLYGQYRRIKGNSERGVLTGKGVGYGGVTLKEKLLRQYLLILF